MRRLDILAPFVLIALAACGADGGGSPSGVGDVAGNQPGTSPPGTPPGTPPSSPSTSTPPGTAPPGTPPPAPPPPPVDPNAKVLTVLTYNVAGLPEPLSGSHPATNTPIMSAMLNPFDLLVVQEDFAYHAQLISASTYPYKSTPMAAPTPADFGDGLNTFARFPFTDITRTKWTACNGIIDQKNDCLTSKGFSRVVVDLGKGRMVDFYDVHFDAGRSSGDAGARAKQVTQFAAAVASASAGHALIVAGDTNMKATDEATLQQLLSSAGLTCACRALSCAEPNRVDRILFRATPTVKLAAKSYQVLSTFVDSTGAGLSDHEPVRVELTLAD